jgi:uncharacterized membrane protein YhaH (DUF805 family)
MNSTTNDTTWLTTCFAPKGRMNRKKYIVRMIFITVVTISFAMLLSLLFFKYDSPNQKHLCDVLLKMLSIVIIPLQIARLRDLDMSGFFAVGIYILNLFTLFVIDKYPIVMWAIFIISLIYGLALVFIKGTTGSNQNGPDPLQKELSAN